MIVDQLIATLGIKLEGEGNLKKFNSGLDNAAKNAQRVATALGTVAATAGVALAAGLGSFAKSVISVNAQFETFQATLETIEGSSEKAKKSLDWISNFARTTPYEVSELTAAFVKLKSYGIEPMDGTMEVLGNTASAMGKSLNSAVEAFADATTGEYERLKEFGIVADATGKTIKFTWQQNGKEMTRTVAKSGGEVQKFLREVWGVKFSGAMVRQSKTWAGMMSNLSDAWSDFMRRIGNAGFFDTVKRRLADVLDAIGRWTEDGTIQKAADFMSNVFTKAADGVAVVMDRIRTHVSWLNTNWEKMAPIVKSVGAAVAFLLMRAFPLTSALGALALVVDDVFTKMQGGESVTGKIIDKFIALNDAIKDAWIGFLDWRAGLPAWAEDVREAFHDFGKNLADRMLAGLRSMNDEIKKWFMDLIPDWAKQFFGIGGGNGFSTGGSFGGEGFKTGGSLGRGTRSIRYGDNRGSGSRNGTILPVGNTRVPVVIRNNNPAALSLMRPGSGEFAERQAGYVGATRRPANEGGYYAKYATPEHGVAANAELLKRYGLRGIDTPDQIVRRWSVDPAAHSAYSRRLQAALGVAGNARLDLNDPDVLQKILMTKSAHESGRGRPIWGEDVFRRGVRREFAAPAANSALNNNYLGWKQKQMDAAEGKTVGPMSSNQNVTITAPITMNVQKATDAPEAAGRALQDRVNRVRPARMQASPAA